MKDGTEFLDELKDKVHDLYDENHKLKEEIGRLNNIINELALLFDDYMSFVEVLEKYNYKLKGDKSNGSI